MSKPLISVIMAVFNVGDLSVLDLAITSIVQQDISDWELLICDDGSTDGTYERAMEWEQRDSRICVIRNTHNQKAARARNRCIAMARGTFLAIMDADDACDSNRLRVQSSFLVENSQYAFVGLKGERFCNKPGDTNNPYWFCPAPSPSDFLMTLPFVHASLMFRSSALADAGGYEETTRVIRSEDYDMLLRMYAMGMRGANIDKAIYYIREDEQAYSRRKYRYRLNETAVKMRGFRRMGLMPRGFLYALKPLIVGLIPMRLLNYLKRCYYGKKQTTDRCGDYRNSA